MAIIPDGRVKDMLAQIKKNNGEEAYEATLKTLDEAEAMLGDDPLAWWGALVTTGAWNIWFVQCVAVKCGLNPTEYEDHEALVKAIEQLPPELLEAALQEFHGCQVMMLLDAFWEDHPMAKVAKLKFEKDARARVEARLGGSRLKARRRG